MTDTFPTHPSKTAADRVRDCGHRIAAQVTLAPLFAETLILARHCYASERAGRSPTILLLSLQDIAEPLLSEAAPMPGLPLDRSRHLYLPCETTAAEMALCALDYPCDLLLLTGKWSDLALPGMIWKLFWNARCFDLSPGEPDRSAWSPFVTARPSVSPASQWPVIPPLPELVRLPLIIPAADQLWPDTDCRKAFDAFGGWTGLFGDKNNSEFAGVYTLSDLRPHPPRMLIWTICNASMLLPRLPADLPRDVVCLLLAEKPVSAPAPWRVAVFPAGVLSVLEGDPTAGPDKLQAYLPPHDISLFLTGPITIPQGPLDHLLMGGLAGHAEAYMPPALPGGARAVIRQMPSWSFGIPHTETRLLPAEFFPVDTSPDLVGSAFPLPPSRGWARQIRADSPAPIADVTILTPTGDRLAAFARCAHLVQTQTIRPKLWLIVDDGVIAVNDTVPLPDWALVIRRPRQSDDPPHTLSANLRTALPHIPTDKVVIMEDDDWYAPDYLEQMTAALDGAEMAGLNHIHYYHLRAARWKTGTPPAHTALAQTAFRLATAGQALARVCTDPAEEVRQIGVVDRHWWHAFQGEKRLIRDHAHLHLGIKGGFGRAGLAVGHDASEVDYIPDPEGEKLAGILGEDNVFYNRLRRLPGGPDSLVIYSAWTAGEPPPEILVKLPDGQARTVLFTSAPGEAPAEWQAAPYDEIFPAPRLTAAKPLFLPHLYFPDCEWSLWIDPSLFLLEDPALLLQDLLQREPGSSIAAFAAATTFDPRVLLRRHNDPAVMQEGMGQWQRILSERPANPILMLPRDGALPVDILGCGPLVHEPAFFVPPRA